jgi:hypothetical protein
MTYEFRFIATSGVASEIVRIVGDSTQIEHGAWLLHSCYISPLKAKKQNEIRLRKREAELDSPNLAFQRVDIKDFSTELSGVDMDEMGISGFTQKLEDLVSEAATEEFWNSAQVHIGLCDGIYWTIASKDSNELERIQSELRRRLPKLKFE